MRLFAGHWGCGAGNACECSRLTTLAQERQWWDRHEAGAALADDHPVPSSSPKSRLQVHSTRLCISFELPTRISFFRIP